MSEIVGRIFITDDYSKFKKLKGNRQINRNQTLKKSIERNGIIIPIEINENFEILDGQNRYEIAKELKKSIPYRISTGIGIDEVIVLNSTTKSWTVLDYIKKYIVDDNKEYEKLLNLHLKNKRIPISSLASAGEGYIRLSSQTTKSIREGKFAFYNYEMFEFFLIEYNNFLNKTGLKGGQYVFFAFFDLYTVICFDSERLINGLKGKEEKVNRNTNSDVILEIFIEAHNYRLGENSSLAIAYELSKKEKPIITSERNTMLIRLKGQKYYG